MGTQERPIHEPAHESRESGIPLEVARYGDVIGVSTRRNLHEIVGSVLTDLARDRIADASDQLPRTLDQQ